jgi:hypothetical protein
MNLEQIQRSLFNAVCQPLTAGEKMRSTKLARKIAEQIIKPNDGLTSFERLEIYNRQYWFRLLSCLSDDFDGLRALLGEAQFQKMARAYLVDFPSRSFTLRDLGHGLSKWLPEHLEFAPGREQIAVEMARLEWAEIEAFDAETRPTLSIEDIAQLGDDSSLELQPFVSLLELTYPAHEFLLRTRKSKTKRLRRRADRHLPPLRKTFLAVHRLENSVYFKELEPSAFAVVDALKRGSPLSEALAVVNWTKNSPEMISTKVQAWFKNWASLGWFTEVRRSL